MTINAASTTCTRVIGTVLYVTSTNGFNIGDTIIIESTHGYGEEGIAGSQYDNRFPNNYYLSVPQGLSFVARVTYVARNRLVLDSTPPSSAVGLQVHKCNAVEIESAVSTYKTIVLPPGELAISRPIHIGNISNFALEGRSTTIFSPRGVPSASIFANNCNSSSVTNLTIRGNVRQSGYGLLFSNGQYQQGNSWPSGLLFSNCNECAASQVKSIDVWQNAVGFTSCVGCSALDCETVMTEGLYQYVQWCYMAHFSTNTLFARCRVTSPTLIAGFSDVLSMYTSFVNCVGTNAVVESNGGGHFLFDNLQLGFTPNSEINGFSSYNPCVNINTNLQDTSRAMNGGIIRNASINFHGKPFASGHVLAGIIIAPSYRNVVIDGLEYTADTDSLCGHIDGYIVNANAAGIAKLYNPVVTSGPAITKFLNVIPEDKQ